MAAVLLLQRCELVLFPSARRSERCRRVLVRGSKLVAAGVNLAHVVEIRRGTVDDWEVALSPPVNRALPVGRSYERQLWARSARGGGGRAVGAPEALGTPGRAWSV
jgi:hypothetical protein